MRATVIYGAHDVRLESRPDPKILAPTDAIVQVTASCVCGSDLWRYRGIRKMTEPSLIGHEFVGVVSEVGSEVRTLRPGQFVIAPFSICDNTCVHCRNGVQTSCERLSQWGGTDADGLPTDAGQGEFVRAPLADGTLVACPDRPDAALLPHLLALTDVMGTGHHAAVRAGVAPGSTVAVIGDGAVGLCAVLASARLGAERIIAMSRHQPRQELATTFGASDIVTTRGQDGIAEVKELTGIGVDCALECVGTAESMAQALGCTRPGGMVGFVGVPEGGPQLPVPTLFGTNIGVRGGVAPVRGYIPDLLTDVLAGSIAPGLVFDRQFALSDVAEAYAAMDARRVIKSMLLP